MFKLDLHIHAFIGWGHKIGFFFYHRHRCIFWLCVIIFVSCLSTFHDFISPLKQPYINNVYYMEISPYVICVIYTYKHTEQSFFFFFKPCQKLWRKNLPLECDVPIGSWLRPICICFYIIQHHTVYSRNLRMNITVLLLLFSFYTWRGWSIETSDNSSENMEPAHWKKLAPRVHQL